MGGLMFHIPDVETGVGIGYTVATYGSPYHSVTAGLGWGYAGKSVSNEPILVLGGEYQLSNNVKLVTENWVPPQSSVALMMFGVRFFGDHLAADFALMHPAGSDISGFPFLPWVGIVYNFGGR